MKVPIIGVDAIGDLKSGSEQALAQIACQNAKEIVIIRTASTNIWLLFASFKVSLSVGIIQ